MSLPWHIILDQSPAMSFVVARQIALRVKNAESALNVDPLPLFECSAYRSSTPRLWPSSAASSPITLQGDEGGQTISPRSQAYGFAFGQVLHFLWTDVLAKGAHGNTCRFLRGSWQTWLQDNRHG